MDDWPIWIKVSLRGGHETTSYDGLLVRADTITQVRRIKETGDIEVYSEGEWRIAHDMSEETVAEFGKLFDALDLADQA